MNDNVTQAFQRAAKNSPAYRAFTVYSQAVDDTHGRPLAGRFVLAEEAVQGRIHWLDVDQLNRTMGGEVGDGVATLLTAWAFTPAALQDSAGQWYSVTGALGQDSLGVGTKLAVKRWKGDAPTVEANDP